MAKWLLVALDIYALVEILRKGAVPTEGLGFKRADEPGWYWGGFAVTVLIVAGLTYLAWTAS